MVTGRQSEGSIVRGFDSLFLTLTLTITLNSNPRPIYSTYMTVGLSNPRINGLSDYRYITARIIDTSCVSSLLCFSTTEVTAVHSHKYHSVRVLYQLGLKTKRKRRELPPRTDNQQVKEQRYSDVQIMHRILRLKCS